MNWIFGQNIYQGPPGGGGGGGPGGGPPGPPIGPLPPIPMFIPGTPESIPQKPFHPAHEEKACAAAMANSTAVTFIAFSFDVFITLLFKIKYYILYNASAFKYVHAAKQLERITQQAFIAKVKGIPNRGNGMPFK